MWEKEKMLVTSIFSFSHNVFKKASNLGLLKVGIVWQRVKNVSITETKSDATVLFSCIEKSREEKGIPFDKLKGFGSDRASVMVGRHKGVASKVKDRSPHCISIHCMAHRFNLASKNIAVLKDSQKTSKNIAVLKDSQ